MTNGFLVFKFQYFFLEFQEFQGSDSGSAFSFDLALRSGSGSESAKKFSWKRLVEALPKIFALPSPGLWTERILNFEVSLRFLEIANYENHFIHLRPF
jgi:hypothetical protein